MGLPFRRRLWLPLPVGLSWPGVNGVVAGLDLADAGPPDVVADFRVT